MAHFISILGKENCFLYLVNVEQRNTIIKDTQSLVTSLNFQGINDGCIPFSCACSRALVLYMLTD